jgi:hypothetical protein
MGEGSSFGKKECRLIQSQISIPDINEMLCLLLVRSVHFIVDDLA